MRFSIRDLALVTAIVALALGATTEAMRIYWLEQKLSRAEFDRAALMHELERFGYMVIPDEYGIDFRTPEGMWIRSTFSADAPPRFLPNSSAPRPKSGQEVAQ